MAQDRTSNRQRARHVEKRVDVDRPSSASRGGTKPTIQEIYTEVATVCGIAPGLIKNHSTKSGAGNTARILVCVLAKHYGHRLRHIADELGYESTRGVERVMSTWVALYDRTPSLVQRKIAVLRALGDTSAIEVMQARMAASKKERSADEMRNRQIRQLRERGWTAKSIARYLSVNPELVCDVLGLDHAFARS